VNDRGPLGSMLSAPVPIPYLPAPVDGEDWEMIWENVGTLRASVDGSTSTWSSVEGADPALVRKIRQGMARAFLARLGGQTAFHAGAVAWGDRGLLLVGPSGGGKSTTVAALCKRGAAMLADDAAVVVERDGVPWLVPSEDRHWLHPDARESLELEGECDALFGKIPVRSPVAAAADGGRLIAVISLRFVDAGPVRIEPVVGAAAFAELLPALLRFVVDEPGVQRWETDRLAEMVTTVPCYALHRQRGHGSLDEVNRLCRQIVELP
jgi:hypothetical protein